MENVCHKYAQQILKAKETLASLEAELYKIRQVLKDNPTNSEGLRMLKQLNLDITITVNELEHSQFRLDECKSGKAKV